MPTPIITVSQMREWENASWAAGRAEADVIRRVGELAARLTVIHAVLSAGTAGPEYRRAFEDGSPGVPD